jgi:hypothetical protein
MSDPGSCKVYTNVLTAGSLLTAGEFLLNAPHYQRPYEWEERNIRQLLSDIFTGATLGHISLLGNVVLMCRSDLLVLSSSDLASGSWPHYTSPLRCEIVDGQQRLTTLFILYAIVRDRMLSYLRALKAAGYQEQADDLDDVVKNIAKRLGAGEATDVCMMPQVRDKEAFLAMFVPGNGCLVQKLR